MMRYLIFVLLVFSFMASIAQTESENLQRWEPNLESISNHQAPEWLKDAKLGIQFVGAPMDFDDAGCYHWERAAQRTRQLGVSESAYYRREHLDRFKVVGGVNYVWDIQHPNDPEQLMNAYERTGAKFLVSMLQGAYPGTEGLRMMPQEVKAANQHDFNVGIHYNLLRRDGIPSMGNPGYVDWWRNRVKNEVKMIGADFLFFDGAMAESSYFKTPELVSWYYNWADSLGKEVWVNDDLGLECVESLNYGDVFEGEGYTMNNVSGKFYLNWDMLRNEWSCWVNEFGIHKRDGSKWEWIYRPVKDLLQLFVYNVSMGGGWCVQMVNTQKAWETMWEIGDWLAINGDAIYNTRPYLPPDPNAKRLPDDQKMPKDQSGPKHWWWRYEQTVEVAKSKGPLYFTHKKDKVYAIHFGWPGESVVIPGIRVRKGSKIQMLGVDNELKWEQKGEDIIIYTPLNRPCNYAYSFVIQKEY